MNSPADPISALQAYIRESIPLARAIDLGIDAWDGDTLTMSAPLAPNINDKGCAFGGSLASTMTLAGWALATLHLRAHGHACNVFVARSSIRYLAPVWHDFRVVARLDEGSDWTRFVTTLNARGKARIGIRCRAQEIDGHADCAILDAQFAAKRPVPTCDSDVGNTAQ